MRRATPPAWDIGGVSSATRRPLGALLDSPGAPRRPRQDRPQIENLAPGARRVDHMIHRRLRRRHRARRLQSPTYGNPDYAASAAQRVDFPGPSFRLFGARCHAHGIDPHDSQPAGQRPLSNRTRNVPFHLIEPRPLGGIKLALPRLQAGAAITKFTRIIKFQTTTGTSHLIPGIRFRSAPI